MSRHLFLLSPPLFLLVPLLCLPSGQKEQPPTRPVRHEHAQLQRRLEHLAEQAGNLLRGGPAPRRTAQGVVDLLKEHVLDHAHTEQRTLYPAVDAFVGCEPVFTSSMRHDQRVIERWIGRLESALSADPFDAVAFARRVDRLLGLLEAHFEKEEHVLLPILEANRTPGEVHRGPPGPGPPERER
jgi:hemerythrin-like domain-containing protein